MSSSLAIGNLRPPDTTWKPVRPSRSVLNYVVLALLFAIAVAYQLRTVEYRYPAWFGMRERATWPFLLSPDEDSPNFRIVFLQPNALQAGLRQRDTLVAINSRKVTGTAVFGEAIAHARAGSSLKVTVRSNDATVERSVTLTPLQSGTLRIVPLVGVVVMPVFCLLLGFGVAAVRPSDRRAWLLLAFLLGFTTFFNPGVEFWGPGTRDLGAIYHALLNSTWQIWLLLFGIYFPEPFPTGTLGRTVWKWVTWVIVVPLALGSVARIALSVGTLENSSSVFALRYLLGRIYGLIVVCGYAATAGFFACTTWKWRVAASPDFKRRLRIALLGATIGFTPVFVLGVIARIRQIEVEELFPSWVFGTAYLLLFVFPLTVAYVIVVQRALDVRVVIRQGLQYTLARRGVIIIQACLSVALLILVAAVVTSQSASPRFAVVIMAIGLMLIFVLNAASHRVAIWIDQRFFREAYSGEQILSDLAEKVRTMVETRALLEMVTRRIADSLHVPQLIVFLENAASYVPAYSIGYVGPLDAAFSNKSATVKFLAQQKEPARIYFDDANSWIFQLPEMTDDERDKLARLKLELLLPLLVKDALTGFISLGQKLSEAPYSSSDLRLLSSVAAQTGLALEVSRLTTAMGREIAQRERLNRELEIAREVQEHLFPQRQPAVLGLDYFGQCRPAREVGGDYFDFLELPDNKFGVAIGDVSGKGISAALMMANLEALLRAQAHITNELPLLMMRVNNLLCDASAAGRFATFFYAQYVPSSRQLCYVNAGHNPPVVIRRDGCDYQTSRLDAGGPVIGLLRDVSYQQGYFALQPGDSVILFTDGVSESMNSLNQEWGEEQLIESAKACYDLGASQALNRIMDKAVAFAEGAPQHDDMTLVVLHIID
jgi:sigma-B regulation protein RsbU (phosphoserine phosphatase)